MGVSQRKLIFKSSQEILSEIPFWWRAQQRSLYIALWLAVYVLRISGVYEQPIRGMSANRILGGQFETIIGWGFCDIQNSQGRGKDYQPKAKADNLYRDLDYSGYHKNRI